QIPGSTTIAFPACAATPRHTRVCSPSADHPTGAGRITVTIRPVARDALRCKINMSPFVTIEVKEPVLRQGVEGGGMGSPDQGTGEIEPPHDPAPTIEVH